MALNQELSWQEKELDSAGNELREKNNPRVLNRSLLLAPEILVLNVKDPKTCYDYCPFTS